MLELIMKLYERYRVTCVGCTCGAMGPPQQLQPITAAAAATVGGEKHGFRARKKIGEGASRYLWKLARCLCPNIEKLRLVCSALPSRSLSQYHLVLFRSLQSQWYVNSIPS